MKQIIYENWRTFIKESSEAPENKTKPDRPTAFQEKKRPEKAETFKDLAVEELGLKKMAEERLNQYKDWIVPYTEKQLGPLGKTMFWEATGLKPKDFYMEVMFNVLENQYMKTGKFVKMKSPISIDELKYSVNKIIQKYVDEHTPDSKGNNYSNHPSLRKF